MDVVLEPLVCVIDQPDPTRLSANLIVSKGRLTEAVLFLLEKKGRRILFRLAAFHT